jgi:hypothetical protein
MPGSLLERGTPAGEDCRVPGKRVTGRWIVVLRLTGPVIICASGG